MTTSRIPTVLAALPIVLALAACGGGADDSAAASGTGEAAGASSVTIDNLAYSPADLAVTAGTEVTWTNDDEAPHTITFDDDAVQDSDKLATGDTFSTTFDQAGSYTYICAIHPDMTAKVTVS